MRAPPFGKIYLTLFFFAKWDKDFLCYDSPILFFYTLQHGMTTPPPTLQ